MERRKVLLRRADGDSYVEVGLITAQQGRSLTVLTRAGDVAQQERGPGDITPDEGSYFHVLRVAPGAVERGLDVEPARIFKQLIHDFPDLTARGLKEKLYSSMEAADRGAWERAKPILEADVDVIASRGRVPKYRLRDEIWVDLLDLLPAHVAVAPYRAELAAPGLTPEGRADSSLTDEADADAGPSEVQAVMPVSTFVERLGPIATDLGLRSTSDVARHLLAVGAVVSRMPAPAQVDLVASLNANERRMLAVSTGELKNGLLADEFGSLGVTDYESALDAGMKELDSRSAEAKDLARALARLLERATTGRRLAPELLIRLAKTFSERTSNEKGLDLCLVQLSERLASANAGDLASFDLPGLARATRSAPLSRTGGRARLVSTLYRTVPDEVSDVRWWQGATLEALADAARGALGPVLDDHRVTDHTVAPTVRSYVDGVSTRSGVSVVWGLPLPLARHVTGEQLMRALRRVSAGDPLLGSWLETLAGRALVNSLQSRIAELEADVDRAQEAAKRATTEADAIRERLRTAAGELSAIRNAEAGNRDAHDRQVRIDAVRALAVLAAQVSQSSAAREDLALMRQVEHACRREGLVEFDHVGKPTIYDPERHDALSDSLLPGSPSTVVRGGYRWAEGDRRVVLVKAHVVAR